MCYKIAFDKYFRMHPASRGPSANIYKIKDKLHFLPFHYWIYFNPPHKQ